VQDSAGGEVDHGQEDDDQDHDVLRVAPETIATREAVLHGWNATTFVDMLAIYRVYHKSRYTFVKGRISVIRGPILLSLGLF
jgi:hypothetical protein